MEGIGELLAPLVGDDRVGPVHVCLYLAIVQCRERQGLAATFFIRREELMRLAKIRGKTTYFRTMGELAEWGYVEYWPSRDKGGRSRVKAVKMSELGLFWPTC
jgi:hypothetical protein